MGFWYFTSTILNSLIHNPYLEWKSLLVVIKHQIKILCLRKILQITQEIIRSSTGCIIIWKAVSRITRVTIPSAIDEQGIGEENYLRTTGKRSFRETVLCVFITLFILCSSILCRKPSFKPGFPENSGSHVTSMNASG